MLALISLAHPANACSCASPAGCGLPKDFPLAFTGKVIRKQVSQPPSNSQTSADGLRVPAPPRLTAPLSTITFSVSEYLNGWGGAEININTNEGCCACGYDFAEGVEYLVFAQKQRGAWSTGTCTPTQPISTGAALRDQLRAARSNGTVAQIFGFAGRTPESPAFNGRWNVLPVGNLRVQAIGTRRVFEATTADTGAFTFTDLPADNYRIEPVAPTGLRAAEAAPRTPSRTFEVTAATRGCEVNLWLLNDGELAGVLVTAAGAPVRALVRAIGAGDSIPEPQRIVASDETGADGRFRLPIITTGKYYISVSTYRNGQIDRTRTIYYPGASNSKEATVFEVKNGEHVNSIRFVLPE